MRVVHIRGCAAQAFYDIGLWTVLPVYATMWCVTGLSAYFTGLTGQDVVLCVRTVCMY